MAPSRLLYALSQPARLGPWFRQALFRRICRSPALEVLSLSPLRLCDHSAAGKSFSPDSQQPADNFFSSAATHLTRALAAVASCPFPFAPLDGQPQTPDYGVPDQSLGFGGNGRLRGVALARADPGGPGRLTRESQVLWRHPSEFCR